MKYIYNTSQMSKLSLTLHTFSITGLVAGLFLTELSFFLIKNTNIAIEDFERYILPIQRFSARKVSSSIYLGGIEGVNL